MEHPALQGWLEQRQIAIYFLAIAAATVLGLLLPATTGLSAAINPALAVMLFATFLQVPLAEAGRAVLQLRFMAALLSGNFLIVPLLVLALLPWLPEDPLVRFGALLVLLAPCIDYVITFSHMGKAKTQLLLAATPALLIIQMALLPLYLGLFLGEAAIEFALVGPFISAFVFLILLPLGAAFLLQGCATRKDSVARLVSKLGLLPVPATALVLFIVVLSVIPQIGSATNAALRVAPIYLAFAVLAPLAGWLVARAFRLDAGAGRAVAFSCGTRNSLVVLPLALAVPGAIPLLPAVIVTQTMVELIACLFYIRWIPRLPSRVAE